MGIPAWAPRQSAGSTTGVNTTSAPAPASKIAPTFNKHYPESMVKASRATTPSKFPVHRIEDSPILAHYQSNGSDVGDRNQRKGIDLDRTCLLPRCRPDEVLFKIKSVRFVDTDVGEQECQQPRKGSSPQKGQRKMVELAALDQTKEVEVTTRSHVKNLLPTSTMVMEKQPDEWYRKFSRNLHGLKCDKPYSRRPPWPPSQEFA